MAAKIEAKRVKKRRNTTLIETKDSINETD
jgi:hypothetical protein